MIEVLKQALDALEAQGLNINGSGQLAVKAKYKLRKAIAELESQEPVVHQNWCASLTQLLLSMPPQPAPCNCHPPHRKWAGSGDLEDSNAYLTQPVQRTEQEPVAWMDVIVVNLMREGINKHRARELAEHFIKHTTHHSAQRRTLELCRINNQRKANMTQDEALKLAFDWYGSGSQDPDEFEKLIKAIAKLEREACAKVADGWPDYDVEGLAEAIRAREKNT